jgi:hypothetical protein
MGLASDAVASAVDALTPIDLRSNDASLDLLDRVTFPWVLRPTRHSALFVSPARFAGSSLTYKDFLL